MGYFSKNCIRLSPHVDGDVERKIREKQIGFATPCMPCGLICLVYLDRYLALRPCP